METVLPESVSLTLEAEKAKDSVTTTVLNDAAMKSDEKSGEQADEGKKDE